MRRVLVGLMSLMLALWDPMPLIETAPGLPRGSGARMRPRARAARRSGGDPAPTTSSSSRCIPGRGGRRSSTTPLAPRTPTPTAGLLPAEEPTPPPAPGARRPFPLPRQRRCRRTRWPRHLARCQRRRPSPGPYSSPAPTCSLSCAAASGCTARRRRALPPSARGRAASRVLRVHGGAAPLGTLTSRSEFTGAVAGMPPRPCT